MNIKSSEKEFSSDEEESKSFLKRLYEIFLSNWQAFLFALIITIITVVAVPIIYSIKKGTGQDNHKILSWASNGNTITSNRTNSSQLGYISAITFDSNNVLYIADQSNNRIVTLINQNLLIVVGRNNGTSGSDSTSLNGPMDIYIDSTFNIYIADMMNNRILKWSTSTNTGQTLIISTVLNQPTSITMDNLNNILYIADYGNNRIIQFNLTTSISTPYLNYTMGADRRTYIRKPISVRFDSTSYSVIIAQQDGFNIVRWIPGGINWQLIAGSASSELNGTSRTLFNTLCSTYLDFYGNIYVADCYNQRIQYFPKGSTPGRTLDGIVLAQGKTIAGVISANGTNPYLFNQPTSVALDSLYNLYVADSKNYRIQMFKQL